VEVEREAEQPLHLGDGVGGDAGQHDVPLMSARPSFALQERTTSTIRSK
jgi:hypothetical protein